MTRDEVLDLIQRWLDNFAKRDLEAFGENYAPDAAYESPLVGGRIEGREAIVQSSRTFLSGFPDAVMTHEPPIIDGDRAVVLAEISGKHVGTFLGFAPTGKPMRIRLVFLLDVRDGHIILDRRLYDFTGLLVQVGVLKAKPA